MFHLTFFLYSILVFSSLLRPTIRQILLASRTPIVERTAARIAMVYANMVRYEDEFCASFPRASAATATCVERLIDWKAYEIAMALALAFPCSERIRSEERR